MLRDRFFAAIPTFGMRMAPVLAQRDTLWDDEVLCQAVQAALVTRFPATATAGRPSTPVEVMLRMLVVQHRYGGSCPQTAHAVSASLVLRQLCRVSVAPVPDQRPLHRGAKRLQPATRHRLLAQLVPLACQSKVTQGRMLRLDGTVVAPHIHHPPDSPRRYDGVRVLRRALGKAMRLLRQGTTLSPELGADWTLQARDQMQRLMAVARQRGEVAAERHKTTYRALLDVPTPVGARAHHVQALVPPQTTAASQRLAKTCAQCLPRGEQVVTQTTRRVLQGEQGPASEQLVSLCEPDTAIMRQGTPGKPTEFGRGGWRDEGEGGMSRRSAVLDGHRDNKAPGPLRLAQQRQQLGQPPTLRTGDRGRHATANEREATTQGVPEVVRPTPGQQSAKRLADARQAWLRAGRNWRAGMEGRRSGLQRRHTLDRGR